MRLLFRGDRSMPAGWRAAAERALLLELSRFADRLKRVAVTVTVKAPARLRLKLVLDRGARLDLEHLGEADADALQRLARRAARTLGHELRTSSFRMVS